MSTADTTATGAGRFDPAPRPRSARGRRGDVPSPEPGIGLLGDNVQIVSAPAVLTPRLTGPGWVAVRGERVVAVGEGRPPRPADVDLGVGTIAPGYVDVHCHGGAGASFTSGDPDEAARAARGHLGHGTTSVVASLVSDEIPALEERVRALRPVVDDGLLAGLHLEGPWLSPRHAGAHRPDLLRAPEPADLDRLLAAADGAVRMVTAAPELPGGIDLVRRLHDAGVVAAVGHTDADYDTTRAALDAGATAATHLFNAERGLHHRDPGPIPALLEHQGVHVEVIADGVHVHHAVLALAARSLSPGRLVLVTDAMAAAGAPDGDYLLGPLRVEVRDGVARLADGGTIAGSTLTMDAAVRFAVHEVGLSLEQAVTAATQAPAQMLGLTDVGRLQPGARADLLCLDEHLQVSAVMQRGRWVS